MEVPCQRRRQLVRQRCRPDARCEKGNAVRTVRYARMLYTVLPMPTAEGKRVGRLYRLGEVEISKCNRRQANNVPPDIVRQFHHQIAVLLQLLGLTLQPLARLGRMLRYHRRHLCPDVDSSAFRGEGKSASIPKDHPLWRKTGVRAPDAPMEVALLISAATAAAYLARMKATRDPSSHTLGAYASDLKDFARFIDQRALCPGQAETLMAYVQHLMVERAVAPRTLRRRMACLRGFYKDMVRTAAITQSPFAGLGDAIAAAAIRCRAR